MKPYPIIAVLALCVACLGGDRACAAATQPMGAVVADGAVMIEKTPDYYLVTLDFTRGKSHREIGEEYGRSIRKVHPNFEAEITQYLVEVATIELLWGPTLRNRIKDIRPQLDQEYQDEIVGIAGTLQGSAAFSAEELAFGYNLMPDIMRTSACSAFGVWGARSATGSNVVYRTLDWFGGLFAQPFPRIAAVTKMILPGTVVYSFGALGHLGAITAINPRTRIFAAILDAPTDGTTYSSGGRRSYNFDLRRALEQSTTTDEIANTLAAPNKAYAFGHLILLADAQRTRILENNIANTGPAPRRALRADASGLNDGIAWGYPDMIGAVNAFMLKGQPNNFSDGDFATINQGRWRLMRDHLAAKLGSPQATLSTQDVKDIMTSYWHAAPRSILPPLPTGDLYNTDTQQMMLYVPATNHLEVFFKPQDNSTPKRPTFVEVKLD